MIIHNTHADVIAIHETKLTHKTKTPKIHNLTTVRTDRLHKLGSGIITLIRNNIIFTTTDIPSIINTHNIELQMVEVHNNNTRHIAIAIMYIPPRDSTAEWLTRIYSAACGASQVYHNRSSLEMWAHTPLTSTHDKIT